MKCKQAFKYFDMLLTDETVVKKNVREHVTACPHCAERYRHWAAIAHALQNAPAPQTPDYLAGRIKAGVLADKRMRSVPKFRFAYTSAAVLLLVSATMWFMLQDKKPEAGLVTNKTLSSDTTIILTALFPEAAQVAVAGDFNGWNAQQDYLVKNSDGSWSISLKLAKGSYQYQFLIDNSVWTPDKANPAIVADGFGGTNSVIDI